MDKAVTNSYKGVFAILIMLHHVALTVTNLPVALWGMKYIGFSIVGYFFFVSGYGVIYSFHKKENYLDSFIKKRMPRILIPYVLIEVVWLIYYLESGIFTLRQYVYEFFLGNWFVTVIILFYLSFYIFYKNFTEKTAFILICGIAGGVFLVAFLLGADTNWYASLIAFPFGIILYEKNLGQERYIKNRLIQKSIAFGIIYVGVLGGRMLLQYMGGIYSSPLLQGILRNGVTLSFLVFMLYLQKLIKLRGRLFQGVSKIYYEIYLVHMFVLPVLSWRMKMDGIELMFATVIISIIGAILLHCLSDILLFILETCLQKSIKGDKS